MNSTLIKIRYLATVNGPKHCVPCTGTSNSLGRLSILKSQIIESMTHLFFLNCNRANVRWLDWNVGREVAHIETAQHVQDWCWVALTFLKIWSEFILQQFPMVFLFLGSLKILWRNFSVNLIWNKSIKNCHGIYFLVRNWFFKFSKKYQILENCAIVFFKCN